jgi:hypothetical protein
MLCQTNTITPYTTTLTHPMQLTKQQNHSANCSQDFRQASTLKRTNRLPQKAHGKSDKTNYAKQRQRNAAKDATPKQHGLPLTQQSPHLCFKNKPITSDSVKIAQTAWRDTIVRGHYKGKLKLSSDQLSEVNCKQQETYSHLFQCPKDTEEQGKFLQDLHFYF